MSADVPRGKPCIRRGGTLASSRAHPSPLRYRRSRPHLPRKFSPTPTKTCRKNGHHSLSRERWNRHSKNTKKTFAAQHNNTIQIQTRCSSWTHILGKPATKHWYNSCYLMSAFLLKFGSHRQTRTDPVVALFIFVVKGLRRTTESLKKHTPVDALSWKNHPSGETQVYT